MSMAAPLSQFLASMKQVYGPLPSSSSSSSSSSSRTPWRPPEKSGGHRGRYLWTDAFGVINFLTLYRETGEERYLDYARSLVATVHDVLGRTRDGRSRLPRATEAEPLAGGLRIGKTEEHGRDGDGQYHHYLTLWMFALNRMTLATGDPAFNDSAISLARAVHPNFFVDRHSSSPRMVWKISMDMSRILVHSEGNLDPIDGYVVFKTLAAASGKADTLKDEIEDYAKVMQRKGQYFASEDMLDLGMSSWTSHWMRGKEEWATVLAKRCARQLQDMFKSGYNDMPAGYRLAFREYGACLGIQCLEPDEYLLRKKDEVVAFWEKYRETHDDLRPITEVMRAAALIPGAFRSGYFGKEPRI